MALVTGGGTSGAGVAAMDILAKFGVEAAAAKSNAAAFNAAATAAGRKRDAVKRLLRAVRNTVDAVHPYILNHFEFYH